LRALFALVVALAACGSSAPPRACPRPALPTAPALLLWRATKERAAPIWLFGTIHHAGRADLPAEVWSVITEAEYLYTETGSLAPDDDVMHDLVRVPPGQPPLQRQMSDDDWYELRDALRGSIAEDELVRLPPWYVMARLRATVAPPPSPTMDGAIVEWSQAQGRTIEALETPESQLAALAQAVTVSDLLETLHERGTLVCRLNDLLAQYHAGNLAELERRLVTPGVSSLLGPRNRAWVEKLIEPRSVEHSHGPEPVFAAVGIGHLLGPESLRVLLEREGYTVVRVEAATAVTAGPADRR
jgi:uncharacterized protein